jgi:hypothetical protein
MVDYTFFCIKRNVYTWIDHIVTTEYDVNKLVSCKIVPLEEGNVSHHLPIRFSYRLEIPTIQPSLPSKARNNFQHFSNANWSNSKNNDLYNEILHSKLEELGCLDLTNVLRKQEY